MAIGTTLFIVLILIAAVWVIFEFKRLRHKIVAIIIIAAILVIYFTFNSVVIQAHPDLDLKTSDGLVSAFRIYFAWIGTAFENLRGLTSSAIDMNWTNNSS